MNLATLLKPVLLVTLLLGALGLAACNTMEGAGQDMEDAGESLSDSAEDAEDEL